MILTHAIFQSHNMHVGIWKNKKHATNWFQKNTCKDVGNQAIMGDRQNMRPSFLPQLLLRSKCASGLLTSCLAWEPEDSCKDTLDVRNRREWGTDKTCAPSSFLAFTQKQLCLQFHCFLLLKTGRNMQGRPLMVRMGERQKLLLRSSCASRLLAFCRSYMRAEYPAL